MKLRVLWYAAGALVWSVAPALALAQTATQSKTGGLVPCLGAADCNLCTMGQLMQNIINFSIGLSIPIAAGLIFYGGWLYVTNRENSAQIEKAHRIFTNTIIGFCIALSGWLVVQTILKALSPNYKSWTTFQCNDDYRLGSKKSNSTTLGDVLRGAGIGQVVTAPPILPVYDAGDIVQYGGGSAFGSYCGDGSDPVVTEGGNYCTSSAGVYPAYVSSEGNSGKGTAQWLSQLEQSCARAGLADCTLAQAIMANESSGNPNAYSSAGAVGLMQVLPTTACGIDPSIPGCSTRNYAEVKQALRDPQTNMDVGTKYIAQLNNQFKGDIAYVAAAYNGGAKANNFSDRCGSGTAWQCQINTGYAETRKYVPRVIGTYSKIKQVPVPSS